MLKDVEILLNSMNVLSFKLILNIPKFSKQESEREMVDSHQHGPDATLLSWQETFREQSFCQLADGMCIIKVSLPGVTASGNLDSLAANGE